MRLSIYYTKKLNSLLSSSQARDIVLEHFWETTDIISEE
jgi:hypothetical protein